MFFVSFLIVLISILQQSVAGKKNLPGFLEISLLILKGIRVSITHIYRIKHSLRTIQGGVE